MIDEELNEILGSIERNSKIDRPKRDYPFPKKWEKDIETLTKKCKWEIPTTISQIVNIGNTPVFLQYTITMVDENFLDEYFVEELAIQFDLYAHRDGEKFVGRYKINDKFWTKEEALRINKIKAFL